MTRSSFVKLLIASVALSSLFTSCANYKATALSALTPDTVAYKAKSSDSIKMAAKAFTKADCKKYLDRDVLSKGYQPVQLYIENNSDHNFVFTLNRISLPCASPEEVAERVHTSTIGRAAGYGAAALLTSGLFVIPAIVDGVKSSQANKALDTDFAAKTAKNQTVFSHSHMNMLIFVPVSEFRPEFEVTLIDENTSKPKIFTLATER